MEKRYIDIWSDDILLYEDQLNYKKSFMEKFSDQMQDKNFYFDNIFLVANLRDRQPTISGVYLNEHTCKQFTNKLIKYFKLTVN